MHRIAAAAWLGLAGAHDFRCRASGTGQVRSGGSRRLIARFVAADAVAVGHLDVTRLKAEPLFAKLKQLLPGDAQQIEFTEAAVEQSVEQFLKAGGLEAFVVLTPSLSPLLVVPLSAGVDEATILAILGQAPLETVEKFDGALVAGTDEAVSRLRAAKPPARPGLAKAMAAAGDTMAQMLLIPTEEGRTLVEQMLPRLPSGLGGASTRPASRGINWLALGIDDSPQFSLRLVADAVDAAAADELGTWAGSLLDAVFKLPEFQRLFPDQDALRQALSPQVSQNQVVLQLSGGQILGPFQAPSARRHAIVAGPILPIKSNSLDCAPPGMIHTRPRRRLQTPR